MKKIIVRVSFLLLFFSFQGLAQDTYSLKNKQIELSIDKVGNLITLKNNQTGYNYAGGRALWRLYFDQKGEKDIEVVAKDNIPVIRRTKDELIISYNRLKARGGELAFKVMFRISLEEDKVRFSSEVFNDEAHTIIRELQYPLLGNCQLPTEYRLLTTERGGRLYSDPKKQILSTPYSYMGPDQLFRQMNVKYPAGVSSNCFAFVGKHEGLYFGSHDTTFQDTWHGLRVYPDSNHDFTELEAGFYKYPNCLPGHSWKNDANIIALYSGDWHQTSKIYRKWANTWWEHKEEPLWVKKMTGFQRIIMKHQYGETLFSYSDLPTSIKHAGDSAGVNVVFPFGWWDSGMDNGYPDSYYVTDEEQGGDEKWKEAISAYQEGGGKVILYFNGKLIDIESNFYREGDGKKVSLKNNFGTETPEFYRFSGPGTFTGYYNARSFVVADTKKPEWRRELKRMADRAIELGGNSVFYDQLGYAERTGNWDLNHEFPIPELQIIKDKALTLKMLHDYIDTKDKDLAIGTEWITDVTSQYVDYVHPIFSVAHKNNFIEWFRYTFPEIILTDRNLDGNEPDITSWINRTLLLGLRNNIQTYRLRGLVSETPQVQQYLARINQLKERYSTLLLMGSYRDTEGFSASNEDVEVRSFINGDQMALVVTQHEKKKVAVQLEVPGYQFKESSVIGNVNVETTFRATQTVTLDKDGLAVLIYEKSE